MRRENICINRNAPRCRRRGLFFFYDPPAFLGAETLFPFLAEEMFLFTIKAEPFACAPPPVLLLTNPDEAAFFGAFAFDLFELDFDIIINL